MKRVADIEVQHLRANGDEWGRGEPAVTETAGTPRDSFLRPFRLTVTLGPALLHSRLRVETVPRLTQLC